MPQNGNKPTSPNNAAMPKSPRTEDDDIPANLQLMSNKPIKRAA